METFESPLDQPLHNRYMVHVVSHLCLNFLEYFIQVHIIIKSVLITVTVTILRDTNIQSCNIDITNEFYPYLVITFRKLCCSGS